MPNLTIGAVQATFTADTRKFDTATAGVGQQLAEAGKQAQAAAAKIKAAGATVDQAAASQERAKERARRAWQQELIQQDRSIEKEKQLARARELSALQADIEARSIEKVTAAQRVWAAVVGKNGDMLKGAFGALGVGFGVAAVVGGFKEIITSTMEAGVELGHLTQQTGISIQNLSVLKYAAQTTGIEFDTLQRGFKKLATSVVEANAGTGLAVKSFAALGISEADLKARGNDMYAVLALVADKLHDMPDGIIKNAAATQLFGRAGQQLIPILNEGSKALEALKSQAPVFSPEDFSRMEEMHKSIEQMKGAWHEFAIELTSDVAPALTEVAKLLPQVFGFGHQGDHGNDFGAGTFAIKRWAAEEKATFGALFSGQPGSSVDDAMRQWDLAHADRSTIGYGAGLPGFMAYLKDHPGAASDSDSAAAPGGSSASATPSIDNSGFDRWMASGPLTAGIRASFGTWFADQQANASADTARQAMLGNQAWAQFGATNSGFDPGLFGGRTLPGVTLAPQVSDGLKDLRDSIGETVTAFTNLPDDIQKIFHEGVGSLNGAMAEAITGVHVNVGRLFAGAFRGIANSATRMSLQFGEGAIAKHVPALEKWLNQGKHVQTMSVQAQTVAIAGPGASAGAGGASAPTASLMQRWSSSGSNLNFAAWMDSVSAKPLNGMPGDNSGLASGFKAAGGATGGWVGQVMQLAGLALNAIHPGAGGVDAPGADQMARVMPDFSLDSYQFPGRAYGGPVLAGVPYMVGERGPEPFIPSSNGHIVPNHAMGGGDFYHIEVGAGADAARIRQEVQAAMTATHASAVQTSTAAMREARRRTPGRGR